MSSIVDDEQYIRRRRRRMLSELSQLGIDDEILRDEILKLKARRARIHPSPAPRSKSAQHVGRDIEVKRKQSQTSRAERSHFSQYEDRSATRARPSDSSPVRSSRSRSSNRSLASPTRSTTSARHEQFSKAPSRDQKWNSSISYADGHICPSCATKRGSSNAVGLSSSRHSDSTEHNKRTRSISNRNSTSERHICPSCASRQGRPNATGFSHSRHSDSTEHTRNKHVSKPHGAQSKVISRTNSERHTCSGCAANHGYSKAIGSHPSLPNNNNEHKLSRSRSNQRTKWERHICPDCVTKHSGSYAFEPHSFGRAHIQNRHVLESPDIQSTVNRKLRMSRLLCLGSTAKGDDFDEMEANFPHDSRRVASYKQTYNPHGFQSRSRAIQQDGVTRNSRGMRSPSNALLSRQNAPVYMRENEGIRRRSESRAESLSTLSKSLPKKSTAHARNSSRERLNPVYPSGQYRNSIMARDRWNSRRYAERDEASQESLDLPRKMENVVNSIRSTARDFLSSDVDDILDGIAESKNVSVDSLIESAWDKLDDLEDSFFGREDETKDNASKSCLPKLQMKVSW